MAMTKLQKEANARAHRSLAETRIVDRYLVALETQQEALEIRAQLPALEKQFVKVAKRFAKRKGIERETFKEIGVSESVLRKAGL